MTSPRIPRRKPLRPASASSAWASTPTGRSSTACWTNCSASWQRLSRRSQAYGVEVVDFGMVDDAESAYALLPRLKAADLDLVFCDMVTYATSATFAAIVRELDVPIVLVALQPLPALDYSRASTYMQLCNDDFCSVPEFTGVAIRMGKQAAAGDPGHAGRRPGGRRGDRASGATSPRCCTTCSGRGSATSGTRSNTCSTCRPTRRR